jgi:DMSO/TMAO reductase YedYZ molybdopterin-dependent catalytic subunit/sulfur carrier protein ThiS
MRAPLRAAAAGIVAAGFGVTVAELLAAVTRPAAGPLVAVGGAVIDATPTPVKEFAVRELGTNDKPALLTGIVIIIALLAAVIGGLGARLPVATPLGAALLAVVGAVAALSRPDASWFDAVPSALGAGLAGATLRWLLRRSAVANTPGVRLDRRRFLRAAALVAGGAVAAQAGANAVEGVRRGAAVRTRDAIRLPAAADPAPPLPHGFAPGFVTANLYRVDTALTVPRIDPDTWRLRIHGMVDREISLGFAQLLKRPLIERHVTLNCVSNEVGGPYVGNVRWLGVPLAPLLRSAGIQDGADQILARSVDGMTIGTPLVAALDGRDTMLAVGINGEPLPLEHGFPVRMLTPGLYGYAGACKWLTSIELTRFADADAYWVKRGWAPGGQVKTASASIGRHLSRV